MNFYQGVIYLKYLVFFSSVKCKIIFLRKNVMKLCITILVFSSLMFSAIGQTDPQNYLSRIPSLPEKACDMTIIEKSGYSDIINDLNKDITNEIRQLKKEAKSNARDNEEKIKQNMAKQYGLSEADLEKMKNKKNMSEAERKELMQKMMKNSKMPDQKQSMNNFELAAEQKNLIDKISSINNEFNDKLNDLDKTNESAVSDLNSKREPLLTELRSINDGEGGTEQDAIHRKNVLEKIHFAEEQYCGKMTPLYYLLLEERLAVLKSILPDYKRLQEVNSELNKNSTGIEKDIATPGLMELEAIEEYVGLLKSVFKYADYSYGR